MRVVTCEEFDFGIDLVLADVAVKLAAIARIGADDEVGTLILDEHLHTGLILARHEERAECDAGEYDDEQ